MYTSTFFALLPLASVVAGALAGAALGRYCTPRAAAWALAAYAAVALVLIIRLAGVGEGEEIKAFAPFATLTAGLFPALFGAIPGWLGGRALARRA
ncbi:hypothetical protein EI983_06515 [Roseovarius faecimaris]|uniref:Uncharacterized protein n=1 Tax=Roseovarius faecimaris TaxID=2494550 RepID=A0A6I6IQY0_9RHOB|nr:hypothetical protein [Roseovarius faecimaris]QGX97947.1 hypothetical protein EI983_06515 [Roseovarius faecimaris]